MNRPLRIISVSAALSAAAFAQSTPPSVPVLTVQQEVELYNAIKSLDQGTVKVIDGKPQAVPFVFSSATRFAMALDAAAVKPKVEAYQTTAVAAQARLDPSGKNEPTSQAKLNAELMPLYLDVDKTGPVVLQKVALADLNLDANPIGMDTLTKLKLIINP